MKSPPYWPACGEDREMKVCTLWSGSVDRMPLQISPPVMTSSDKEGTEHERSTGQRSWRGADLHTDSYEDRVLCHCQM